MKSNKLLLGVLAGVAAGALLGVLLSSDKGSKIRKQLAELGDGAVDEMKKKFNEITESVTGKLENDQKSMEKIATKVKTAVEDTKKDVMHGTV
jgi:gas vesicle protein